MSWRNFFFFIFFQSLLFGSDLVENYVQEAVNKSNRDNIVRRQVAIERLRLTNEIESKICNSDVFPFFECIYDDSGTIVSFGGMFGVGVAAMIHPMGSDFRIYKNCQMNPDLSFQCYEKDLIKNTTPIKVFIKRDNSKLSAQYKNSYLKMLPIDIPKKDHSDFNIGFLMEKFMTAYISNKKVLNNYMSPNIYTITTRWGSPVYEFDRYIFMQYLDGLTLSDILKKLRKNEIFQMKNSFRKVLRAYSNLVAVKNNHNENTDAVKKREMLLRISVNNSAGEILARFRYRLSLLDHTLNFLQRVWEQNIYHCDLCHPNLMILEEYLSDPLEIVKIIREGQGFLIDDDEHINIMELDRLPLEITRRLNERIQELNKKNKNNAKKFRNSGICESNSADKFNNQTENIDEDFQDDYLNYEIDPDDNTDVSDLNCEEDNDSVPMNSNAKSKNSVNRQGLRVIRFKLENFRMIDLSFAIDITKEINSRKGADKYMIETPCRIYRPERRDDIMELRRFVDEVVYYTSKSEINVLADTWRNIVEELINENSGISDHVERFLTFDKTVAAQAKQFLLSIQLLQRFFKELRKDIYSPEWNGCWDNLNEWKQIKLINKLNSTEKKQFNLRSTCNIKDMTIAIHKAREQLHHHISMYKEGLFGGTLLDATDTMSQHYSISVAPQYIESKLKEMIELGLYKLN